MSHLVVQYGGAALIHFKMMASSFYGLVTFLAASCCFSDTAQTGSSDFMGHVAGEQSGAAGSGNGNGSDVRKQSFISNLVANMTVPELGEMSSHD